MAGPGVTRAPRVLVSAVVLGQPMGGVRRHNAELLPRAARLLAEGGGRLDVLEGREPVAFDLPPEVGRRAGDVPPGPPMARARAEGGALRRALAQAAAAGEPYDLVHVAHLPAPRGLGLPLTLTVHDLRSLHAGAPFVRRLLAGPVLGAGVRRAARVITVSETVREELLARFGLDAERTASIPNAADHLRPEPRRPAADAPLLALGHLEPRKNLELLVRALAADPDLPPLVLAGAAKGDEALRLERLAGTLGVAARVRFRGPFPDRDLAGLYAEAACVVVPSHVEGFGLAVREAQFAGCPVAVAEAGALPEVAGATVPRFAPDDPRACARAIRAALGRNASELEGDRRRAAAWTWDDAAERLTAVWGEARGIR